MLRDLLEIGFSYVQYILLLVAIVPSPFPAYYSTPGDILDYLNLDLSAWVNEDNRQTNAVAQSIPSRVPLDIRFRFIVVSVCLPLLMALVALFVLSSKRFLLWYLFLMLGVFLFVVGLIATVASDPLLSQSISKQDRNMALYLGSAIIGFSVALLGAFLCYWRSKKSTETQQSIDDIEKREIEEFDMLQTVQRLLLCAILVFFGLLFAHVYSIPALVDFETDNAARDLALGFGVVLLVWAGLLLVWTVMGFSLRGRKLQFVIATFMRDNFLSVLLLLISFMYVPAVSNVVLLFNCHDFACADGTRLADDGSFVHPQYVANNITIMHGASAASVPACEPCSWSNSSCPTIEALFCTAQRASRLEYDPAIPCSALQKYYWPASGIIVVAFVISIPIVNYILTVRSTNTLENDFPLDSRQVQGFTEEEIFSEKVLSSDNVAKFIYDPFERSRKHWRTLFLFHRLFVVVFSVFVIKYRSVSPAALGVGISLGIHALCLVFVVVRWPFARKAENILVVVTQAVLVIGSTCGFATSLSNYNFPAAIYIIVVVLALALPVVSVAVGIILTYADDKRRERAREERVLDAMRNAQEEDEDTLGSPSAHNGGNSNADGLPMDGVGPSAVANSKAEEEFTLETKNETVSSPTTKEELIAEPLHRRRGRSPAILFGITEEDSTPRHKTEENATTTHNDAIFVVDVESPTAEDKDKGKPAPGLHVAAPNLLASPESVSPSAALLIPKHTPSPQSPALRPAGGASPRIAVGAVGGTSFGKQLAKGLCPSPATQAAGNATPSITPLRLPPSALQDAKNRKPTRWMRLRVAFMEYIRQQKEGGAVEAAAEELIKKRPKKTAAMRQWDELLLLLKRRGSTEDDALSPQHQAAAAAAAGNPLCGRGGQCDPTSKLTGALCGKKRRAVEQKLRARLKKLYEEHLDKIHLVQRAVDFKINQDTIRVLQGFFAVTGILGFVAFGMCFLDTVSRDTSSDRFIGAAATSLTAEVQLAGYASWDAMVDGCCCVPFANLKAKLPSYVLDVEKWMCSNGRIREKMRRRLVYNSTSSRLVTQSGYSIRGLCGTTFSAGCTVLVTNGIVSLAGCNSTISFGEQGLW